MHFSIILTDFTNFYYLLKKNFNVLIIFKAMVWSYIKYFAHLVVFEVSFMILKFLFQSIFKILLCRVYGHQSFCYAL